MGDRSRRIRPRRSWAHRVRHAWSVLTGSKDVYIHHSVTRAPDTIVAEAQAMRQLDGIAHNRGFQGISYNFAVMPSGRVWAGRGWRWMGAHNDGENATSFGIVAVGNYDAVRPTGDLVAGIIDTIRTGQQSGRIRKRPRVRGHRDSDATACPGNHLYRRLPEIRRAVGGRR